MSRFCIAEKSNLSERFRKVLVEVELSQEW